MKSSEASTLVLDWKEIRQAQEKNPFLKLSDVIYNILEAAILSGKLEPGYRLNASKIATQLKVSSTPVREAIERLNAGGLIIESHSGNGGYRSYRVFDVQDKDISAAYQARMAVECAAVVLCAQENWRVNLAALRENLEQFHTAVREYASTGSVLCITEIDQQFHSLLIEASGNRFLQNMYNILAKDLNYIAVRGTQFLEESRPDNLLQLSVQHTAIYHAIELGFPELAREAMVRHINFCENNCLICRANTKGKAP